METVRVVIVVPAHLRALLCVQCLRQNRGAVWSLQPSKTEDLCVSSSRSGSFTHSQTTQSLTNKQEDFLMCSFEDKNPVTIPPNMDDLKKCIPINSCWFRLFLQLSDFNRTRGLRELTWGQLWYGLAPTTNTGRGHRKQIVTSKRSNRTPLKGPQSVQDRLSEERESPKLVDDGR